VRRTDGAEHEGQVLAPGAGALRLLHRLGEHLTGRPGHRWQVYPSFIEANL
jgi:hypothetical protein